MPYDRPYREIIAKGSECFCVRSRHSVRMFHHHNCVEMFYVVQGSATHALRFPDGREESRPLSVGDFCFIDYEVLHAYRDGTPDFTVINFLWTPQLVKISNESERSFLSIIKGAPFYFSRAMLTGDPMNHVYHDDTGAIRPLFESALDAYLKQEYGYHELIRGYCTEIVIRAVRTMLCSHPSLRQSSVITEICDYVSVHYAEHVTLTEICREKYFSMPYISKKFKSVCGVSFEQYLKDVRIRHACELLLETDSPIDDVAATVGYHDAAFFRKIFAKHTGLNPSEYRKKSGN